ncbi:MAG: AmmeMemoRadiSam system radical SAM enzyme [Deinococcales bacterium]|jgi:pyruvate formate lyase activating enzyme
MRELLEPGVARAEWWRRLADGRIQCTLCPRGCRLRPGQRGFCFVRVAREDGMELRSYGRTSGMAVDPIEKKPLFHVLPGASLLSFGTIGCNLGCRYCQNWHVSRARDERLLGVRASPEAVARTAERCGCSGVAFTYNDPVVFAEYAIDCAAQAHERGLLSVAVTAGSILSPAREAFFGAMDAANVDLKALDPSFYRRLCLGELEPVQDTLRWLHEETDVWLEVTHLLIPGFNDAPEDVERLVAWFAETLGADVPLHLTAFRPAYRMRDVPPTPAATLRRARRQARGAGLRYAYVGNVVDLEGEATVCPSCGAAVVRRWGYTADRRGLDASGRCRVCGTSIPGRFALPPRTSGARRAAAEGDHRGT